MPLAIAAFFAVKEAIYAARADRVLPLVLITVPSI